MHERERASEWMLLFFSLFSFFARAHTRVRVLCACVPVHACVRVCVQGEGAKRGVGGDSMGVTQPASPPLDTYFFFLFSFEDEGGE